jgi:RHS repeat-associated protein
MVYVRDSNSDWVLYDIVRDYQGSITHLVDDSDGTVVAEYSYDPWGRMRDPETLEIYAPGNEPSLMLGRGYTAHEHLDWFGLINMNARLYDPALGRFLSPAPYVQAPNFSQNALFGINWYDSAARFQTTDGIFTGIDPLAEKYYHISPYAYCAGNPVNVIDPTGMDGIMTGSGTEEDPYVITANYYYQTGSLDSETVDGLNRALADYNNKGRSRKITMSDGSKVFVRFQLSAKEVDNLEESYLNDWTLDANGGQIRYGNKVDTSANPDNPNGNEFGSANLHTISINLQNIEKGVSEGSYSHDPLTKGTFVHEIGHSLGLDHSDNTKIMNKPTPLEVDQFGQIKNPPTYPYVDKSGIGIMLTRSNNNRIPGLGAINKK